ncbi:MAG TPA: hypothetical protein VD930_13765 [Gemmatimonadales bacterium]|nr:hypothetical protein [Gemmatimonadales bacterium]
MPTHKDLKRLIRSRMQKTGEAYTTARANLLRTKPSATIHTQPYPAPADYARLAGKSDAILKEKTGCSWERWVLALDRAKADSWPHPKIAKYVMEKYKIPGWWAQTVTVGYERIKGRREVGQRVDGSFEANKSKTFAAPLGRVYHAFNDAGIRSRWLSESGLTIRGATREKSMRIVWPDRTPVEIWFLRKGKDKSQVALAHRKLPDRAAVDRMKQYWGERLEALKEILMQKAN